MSYRRRRIRVIVISCSCRNTGAEYSMKISAESANVCAVHGMAAKGGIEPMMCF